MELLQLFYFRETAKTENMTEAAGILHVTQPSLSKAIDSPAGRKSGLRELEKETFIYTTSECGFRETISHFCRQASFEPEISCEYTTPEVTCGFVETGLGVAFLPEYLSAMEYTRKVSWIPVKEPVMKRSIWIAWNTTCYLSEAARSFRQFVLDYFSSSPPENTTDT